MPPRRSRATRRFIAVELRHIRLRLGERMVLRDINWRIEPGQRWVLTGANGAGKTQLLKLLAGDVWPMPARASRRSYRLGSQSFEDPYGIKDEIAYLGPERQDRYEHYGWNHRVLQIVGTGLYRTEIPLSPLRAADRQQALRLLARLKIEALATRRFLTLSYGERRLVLLARALAWRPKLLLLDEPFAGLDPGNRERLAAGIRALSRTALPWVLSTHRAEELSIPSTHRCRIESGRIVGRQRITRQPSVPRVDRPRVRLHRSRALRDGRRPSARVLISLWRAAVWREGAAVLRNLSLEIESGQCWVVHGANGSGKSTLVQTLYGDLAVARGGTLVRDRIQPGVALQSFQRRVGLVAPELQTLYPRYQTVGDVVASGLHASLGLNEPATAAELRRVRRALKQVGAAALLERTLRTLSYGQMRRVLFARALVNEPDILLLDEPYAGLDTRTRAALRALIERAIEAGATTVITTHHHDEWPTATTHELELAWGRARYCGPVRRA